MFKWIVSFIRGNNNQDNAKGLGRSEEVISEPINDVFKDDAIKQDLHLTFIEPEIESFYDYVEGPSLELNSAYKQNSYKLMIRMFNTIGSEDVNTLVPQIFSIVANINLKQKKAHQLLSSISSALDCIGRKGPPYSKIVFDNWHKRMINIDWSCTKEAQSGYQWLYLFGECYADDISRNSSSAPPYPREIIKKSNHYNKVWTNYFSETSKIFEIIEQVNKVKDIKGTRLRKVGNIDVNSKIIGDLLNLFFWHTNKYFVENEKDIFLLIEKNNAITDVLKFPYFMLSENKSLVFSKIIELDFKLNKNLECRCFDLFSDLYEFIYDYEEVSENKLEIISDLINNKASNTLDEKKEYLIECIFEDCFDAPDRFRRDLKESNYLLGITKLFSNLKSGEKSSSLGEMMLDGWINPKVKKTYIMPKEGLGQFHDFNFKLLVLDQLMNDGVIEEFDLNEFVEEYDHRIIDPDYLDFEYIPEVKEYLSGLLINKECLSEITELSWDPCNSLFLSLSSLWDGTTNEFNVTSLKDIRLIPNLEKMINIDEEVIEKYKQDAEGVEFSNNL